MTSINIEELMRMTFFKETLTKTKPALSATRTHGLTIKVFGFRPEGNF